MGAVVPMPTEVQSLSKKMRELTMVFDPENLATLLAVPPVVVTVVTALGASPPVLHWRQQRSKPEFGRKIDWQLKRKLQRLA